MNVVKKKKKSLERGLLSCISSPFAWGNAAPVFEQGQVHCACLGFEEH